MNDSTVTTYKSNYTTSSTHSNHYIYNDRRLVTINIWYNGEMSVVNRTIEYSDGKPVALNRNYNENLIDQVKFTFTGDNLTSITSYEIHGLPEVECVETRSYDSYNRVSKIISNCGPMPSLFTYEAGTGNVNDMVLTSGSWLQVYLFPDSFPSELIYD